MSFANSFTLLFLVVILAAFNNISSLERVWANEIVASIDVENSPLGVAYNQDNGDMYVTNLDSDSVSVIGDGNEVIDTISVENGPFAIAYNPDNGYMYVANFDSNTVSIIDSTTNTVADTISVGKNPAGIAHNPDNGYMYVTNYNENTVSVINANTVVDTISVESNPVGVAHNPDNGYMYVANQFSDTVSVINANTVVDTIFVERWPSSISYNQDNRYMYVTNQVSDTVSVIDSTDNTVVDTISVESTPFGVAHNPDNGYMYVTNTNWDSISIINGTTNTVVDTISGEDFPIGVAYSQSNGYMYVTNQESDTVSVIGLAPIANAGPDVAVKSGATVQLDGSGSTDLSGGTLTYKWTQISGPEVSLSDSAAEKPTFTAPLLGVQQNIVFELMVTNDEGVKSEPDSVTVTVSPVSPPTANAGPDQTHKSSETVQLDGSGSTDPSGSILSYQWTQTSGPEVTLSDSTASNPIFTAPEVNEKTDITFQLTVTNEEGTSSEPDEVKITVNPIITPPTPPNEEPKTIGDLIKSIIQNPLDITNSINSANEIRDILTDDNPDNDQIVCDLIKTEDELTSSIREILNC